MISVVRKKSTKVVGLPYMRQPMTGSIKLGPNKAASKLFTYLQYHNNNNSISLQAFQQIVLARYLLGVQGHNAMQLSCNVVS